MRVLVGVFAIGAAFASCVVNVEGAACNSDDNCPSPQRCVFEPGQPVGHCSLSGGSAGGSAGGSSSSDGGATTAGGSSGGGAAGGSTAGGAATGGGSAGGAGGGTADGGTCADAGVNDVNNCGGCGVTCATPLNAAAVCVASRCGRGPCAANFYDVDGLATFGCESTCVGKTCTLPDGGMVTLTAAPWHESTTQRGGFPVSAAGQTSGSQHVNVGVVFDLTLPADGGSEAVGGGVRHRGGLLGRP